jgi:predicted oxidoreductase
MDKRVEAFLRDVLALEGKHSNVVREAVRVRLAKCESQFRKDEESESMKDRAAEMCDRLCRARIVEEMQQRRGTLTAVHLNIVLSVVDGPGRFPMKSG